MKVPESPLVEGGAGVKRDVAKQTEEDEAVAREDDSRQCTFITISLYGSYGTISCVLNMGF
jgi:hypothetical protein